MTLLLGPREGGDLVERTVEFQSYSVLEGLIRGMPSDVVGRNARVVDRSAIFC